MGVCVYVGVSPRQTFRVWGVGHRGMGVCMWGGGARINVQWSGGGVPGCGWRGGREEGKEGWKKEGAEVTSRTITTRVRTKHGACMFINDPCP